MWSGGPLFINSPTSRARPLPVGVEKARRRRGRPARPHMLLALASLGTLPWSDVIDASAVDSTLCYKLEWAGGRVAGIKPISGMPAAHPLVNGTISCTGGTDSFRTYAEGAPIPATGAWHPSGDCSKFKEVAGAQMFYAYGYPMSSSANTGYYKEDAAVIYLVQVESRMYLVLTLDTPTSSTDSAGSGGKFALDLKTTPEMAGIELVVLDDVNEYTGVVDNSTLKYGPWDASFEGASADGLLPARGRTHGEGSFYWRWGKCCPDGNWLTVELGTLRRPHARRRLALKVPVSLLS